MAANASSLPGRCVVQFDGLIIPKPSILGYVRPLSNSEINLNDVLIDGSGGYGHIHPGNIQLRTILAQQKNSFLGCSNKTYINVMHVAASIVDLVRRLDPPGRFLRKNEWSGCWKDIGDERAMEIISLALSDYLLVGRAENDGTSDRARERITESINYAPCNRLKTCLHFSQLPQHLEVVPWLEDKFQNCVGMEFEQIAQHGKQQFIACSSESTSIALEDKKLPKEHSAFQGCVPDPIICVDTQLEQRIQHGKQQLLACSAERTSFTLEDIRLPKEYAVFQGYVPDPITFPKEGGLIPTSEITCNDVLSGRGNLINSHVGNIQFRNIVAHHKQKYKDSTNKRIEKTFAAARVVAIVRSFNPPGRFLRKDDKSDSWREIGDDNARLKAGQALRDSVGEDKVEKKRKELDDPSFSLKNISCEEQATISTLIMLSRHPKLDISHLKNQEEEDKRASFDHHLTS